MRFMYMITVEPPEGNDELDREEVERFARLLDIAIDGARTDCGLRAELELITVLP